MARKRGFFAELQYQNQLAAKQRAQAERAQARAHAAAVREVERARRAAERAAAAAARSAAAEQRAAEKEAKRLRIEAGEAEAEALNAELASLNYELQSILSTTLDVDDYVDLESLRATAAHPPFPRSDLEVPTPEPTPLAAPPEPTFVEPERPTGLGAVFGGKKKHAAAVDAARAVFDAEHEEWRTEAAKIPARQLQQIQERDELEQQRKLELQAARDAYTSECQLRELEVAETNQQLDSLIAGLTAGEPAAVQEYVGIVLGNSVYPDVLAVEHDYEFDPRERELALTVLISPPDHLPAEKSFRYVKAADQVQASLLAKKDLKERYAGIVRQVALRTLHEVFEADRIAVIQTITLEVGTETLDPATGLETRVIFVGVAAERESFMTFDLRNVVPGATLEHLGASLSKSPLDLVGVDGTSGVRGR